MGADALQGLEESSTKRIKGVSPSRPSVQGLNTFAQPNYLEIVHFVRCSNDLLLGGGFLGTRGFGNERLWRVHLARTSRRLRSGTHLVDVGQNTTTGDGSPDQEIQLLVTSDG
jgi:hypothetical protein